MFSLLLAMSLAWAGPPGSQDVEKPESDDPLEYYERGKKSLVSGNYTEAIGDLTAAVELLGDVPAARPPLVKLVEAHRKRYELNRDIEDLRRAKIHLGTILGMLDEELDGEFVAETRATLAEVDSQIEQAENEASQDEPPPQVPPPPVEEPEVQPQPEPPAAIDGPPAGAGRPLIVAGAATAGLGLGLGIVAAVGAAQFSDASNQFQEDSARDWSSVARQYETWGTTAAITGVAAGVLVVSGVTLLAVGLSKRRSSRASAAANGFQLRF